ncbi:hypothetical protein [Litorihabitans aurantiacus]|uniref:Uncharacterized protein n=1 Tax=Litorihabitans aurantiacus TaxID=1930061 RepID=A0AA37UI15_9MICO|nr:hypothetical protein GCM10025875_09160 [Litorihabitans aurantiacus]
MLLTGVAAAVVGVFTATAQGSVGPHEAELAITGTHEVTLDLGPLGSVILDSPAPWPIGVQVDVGEIPASLTEVDNPLDALGGDVTAYAAFFGQPGSAITAAVWALVTDAVARTVLWWSIALVAIAAGQLGAGGLLRAELRAKLHRRGWRRSPRRWRSPSSPCPWSACWRRRPSAADPRRCSPRSAARWREPA